MKLYKRSKLFAYLALLLVIPVVNGASSTDTPRHMVFVSDPQYPWTDKTDAREPESSSQAEKRSRWLIETQYDSIAEFRRNSGGASTVPVMINGDLTAFGHGDQRSYIKSTLDAKLHGLYDYGLGNHDYQNNVNDCRLNNCAAGSIDDLKNRYWGKIENMDLAARSSWPSTIYYGSLAYSKDFGDVHLVQLHNEPTYEVTFSSGVFLSPTVYEITPALDWLERDLRRAHAQGKIILLNLHKPAKWQGSDEQISRFRTMIEEYGVTAVFAGHEHEHAGWRGWWGREEIYGDVPVFLSGAASQQTWLFASLSEDRKELAISVVADNDWRNPREVEVIPVK
jgi:cytolysin (calcineurin-like family phosphatase)